MPNNDDAAQRLIDAILPKLTEALLPQLTEAVEAQIKGVVAKNDDLLAKLATEKAQKDDFAKLLADHEKSLADTKQLTDMMDPKKPKPDATAPVIISKADARDRQKYLAAQAEAAKRGVPMQIGAPNAAQNDDTRTHHATETHLYVTSAAMRDTATYKRLRAQAEREHLTFQPVRTLADVEGANVES